MSIAYLLDTNILLELAKRVPSEAVEGRLAALQFQCAVGAPTVAAVNELVLVTRNTTDFRSFSGLRLENWF